MRNRRELFKLGLLGGAAVLMPSARRSGMELLWADDRPASPPTRPFIVELPIPPRAEPVASLSPAPTAAANIAGGEAPRPDHQRFAEFAPKKLYELHEVEALHSFHPDLPLQRIWGYNGIFPGPTFRAFYSEPILVRIHNDLPANHVGFGMPETSTHLHGGHTGSESDGFPNDFYASGLFKDYHYPNLLAGGDPREADTTLWYHDHRLDFTAQNTYKGLVGFYDLYDDVTGLDTGDETAGLRLPSGEFEVPLVFADKQFTRDGELFFDQFNFDGILGDKFTVNGKIQPFMKVARRKYRFRMLDAGPSRFYQFFLSTGQPLILIGNDGSVLPAPLTVQSVLISPAERRCVIIDFSRYNIGDQIFLVNRLEQEDGRGPSGKLLNPGTPILRFDVDRDAADPSQVPAKLRELPPINLNEVVRTRRFEFNRSQGAWQVNSRFFDGDRVDAAPQQGSAEIWVLKNGGGGWSHPIHIHLEDHRILSRNGRPPIPEEIARKDVTRLGPGDEVRVFLRFRDFFGKYPMHCHNTVHEDHAMMIRWDVVP
jgi:FtsP/CotA-like multicopper oxidase with cupredoxin domain